MTQVILAFPGTGKTYFQQHTPLRVLDSDSSKFSWSSEGVRNPDFPGNYVAHIRESMGIADIVLVSSHAPVRDALVREGIPYTLVFPYRNLKDEYIERFRQRGSSEAFVDQVAKNWDGWISELEQQVGCTPVRLSAGQYLSDLFPQKT
ncbi:hypothetical protein HYY73_02830 [Candidatus Woesearchaeota archaeon]|nr:hypothetical protein [Candidatus Woesearchaeota archaeon]